ncbi:hypothetical protein OG21DRAFT_627362 [Imleria badia]|nr:hypothetical protein OG21DRAFT_627362 [Imleria badia]
MALRNTEAYDAEDDEQQHHHMLDPSNFFASQRPLAHQQPAFIPELDVETSQRANSNRGGQAPSVTVNSFGRFAESSAMPITANNPSFFHALAQQLSSAPQIYGDEPSSFPAFSVSSSFPGSHYDANDLASNSPVTERCPQFGLGRQHISTPVAHAGNPSALAPSATPQPSLHAAREPPVTDPHTELSQRRFSMPTLHAGSLGNPPAFAPSAAPQPPFLHTTFPTPHAGNPSNPPAFAPSAAPQPPFLHTAFPTPHAGNPSNPPAFAPSAALEPTLSHAPDNQTSSLVIRTVRGRHKRAEATDSLSQPALPAPTSELLSQVVPVRPLSSITKDERGIITARTREIITLDMVSSHAVKVDPERETMLREAIRLGLQSVTGLSVVTQPDWLRKEALRTLNVVFHMWKDVAFPHLSWTLSMHIGHNIPPLRLRDVDAGLPEKTTTHDNDNPIQPEESISFCANRATELLRDLTYIRDTTEHDYFTSEYFHQLIIDCAFVKPPRLCIHLAPEHLQDMLDNLFAFGGAAVAANVRDFIEGVPKKMRTNPVRAAYLNKVQFSIARRGFAKLGWRSTV